jgi:hypothetical protein
MAQAQGTQNIMVARACGVTRGEQEAERDIQEGTRTRYVPKDILQSTYFLQPGPTSQRLYHLPKRGRPPFATSWRPRVQHMSLWVTFHIQTVINATLSGTRIIIN